MTTALPSARPAAAPVAVLLMGALFTVASWCGLAQAQTTPGQGASGQRCVVRDPELQGGYSGPCRDGLAEGVGEARGVASYRGEFKSGQKHGQGTKRWPWGDAYEGQFFEDQKHGTGAYVWSGTGPWAGERYQGGFRADRREGVGTQAFADGESYAGVWKDDQIAGPASPQLLQRVQARARADAEALAAVGIQGTKACRRVQLGIGNEEWINGVVTERRGLAIAVRIDDPGRLRGTLNGVELARGVLVWDVAPAWSACR